MRALLDVNVLIALHDKDHINHSQASHWFQKEAQHGWASCPITQNGFLRIMSQSGYANPLPIAMLSIVLVRSTQSPLHQFWPDSISALDEQLFAISSLSSHRQLTDAYLLALAINNNGRFVTLDQTVASASVKSFSADRLLVIS
jgi:uncharacterized protein